MSIVTTLENHEFTKWFMHCVTKKYMDFNGRARRKEYWMFVLVVFVCLVITGILIGILSAISLGIIGMLLYAVVALGTLLPNIAVGIRRMHDIGKSGWWLLAPIYNIYLLVQDGTPGANQYGPNPKGV